MDYSGQSIATSAEVTLNGGLVRESPKNAFNSGLGIIVIWPDYSASGTPPKFDSSPLKNAGWKMTFLLGFGLFSGASC